MWKFEQGTRVQRRIDVYDDTSKLRHGTVTLRYSNFVSQYGPYPELYEVKWDDGQIEKGFLPHGLEPCRIAQATGFKES